MTSAAPRSFRQNRLPRCWSLRPLGRFKRIGFVQALGLRSDWHGRLGLGGGRKKGKKQAEEAARTNRRRTKKRGAAERAARWDKYICRRRFNPRSRSVSFPFSLFPTPNRLCQSECGPKARHEADSFEPAEWSSRLTPGQSGWLGAAAVGSIPDLALSHPQKVNKKFPLFLQRLYLSF